MVIAGTDKKGPCVAHHWQKPLGTGAELWPLRRASSECAPTVGSINYILWLRIYSNKFWLNIINTYKETLIEAIYELTITDQGIGHGTANHTTSMSFSGIALWTIIFQNLKKTSSRGVRRGPITLKFMMAASIYWCFKCVRKNVINKVKDMIWKCEKKYL